ncbi:protein SCAR2-like isoform X2 [Lotus japonicus]|uniref:protein SCAR2-like isoform X2 n=1 Tax=Lotus japonicus TaxID=34305 RepID=UPI002584BAB3|nr:protein SCAR2-like isoform X2 [Lotus japonicus]
MPLSKYLIRNEYGLADPELYRAADKDDPEALLEGVAMAGLVGLLRQLGDLAEFAAEIFHDLHEEVMATAARGHGLMSRVKQLEAEVPSLEKAFFSQTHHSSFFTNGGIDWHPNLRSEQNLVTRGNFPRLIMDSYEECRGPPRLFLLDKFDVAGAGACLKRYTDPSFFKVEPASSVRATVDVHREKRIRKFKKKGARLRDGEAPNVVPTHSKLHQLLLEERIENGYSNPARLVKLKKRQFNGPTVDAKAGKSYMEKFLETPSPDHKMICETSIFPLPVEPTSDDTTEARIKILEISSFNPVKKSLRNENNRSSPNEQEKLELELKPFSKVGGETNRDIVKVKEPAGVAADEMSYIHLKLPDEVKMAISERKKIEGSLDGYHSDDVTSEVDNYLDALTTMESELDTDNEYKPKKKFLNIQKIVDINDKEQQLQARLSDSQSFGDSSTSDDISSFKQDRNEEHIEVQAQSSDSHSTGSSSISDNNGSFRREREEHIELQAHFSDSRSIRNSSSSEENISFKKDRSYFPHFDSSSTVVENVQSEPMFTKTNNCEPEIDDTKSIQFPQIAEFQNTDCGIFVMHDNTHTQEGEISDSVRASSDLITSGLVLSSDLGPASPVVLPAGTQSDETSPDPIELNSRLENDADKNAHVESIASEPVSLSPIEDDDFAVDSPDKISSGKLDGYDDPVIHSDDSLQVSNDLALAHGDEHCDDSVIKILQAQSPEENSSKISVCRDISSQGDDPICPSMEELDMDSSITVALDCQGSKDEGSIMAHQADLEDLSPAVEVPQVSCFTREPFSDLTCNNPQDVPGSAELEVSNSGLQSNFEEMPKMGRSDEINGSTRDVDPVDGDGCFKCPSVDNHVIVNGVVTEIVQSEDQAVYSVPSVDTDENDSGVGACPASGLISAPSTSFSNSQEPVLGSSNSYQMEIESQTVEESISDFADPHKKEIDVNDAVARESLTELDGTKTVGHLEIASPDAPLNSNNLVPGDLSDSGICDDIQKSSPREKLQHSDFVDDAKMAPEYSGLDTHLSGPIFCGQNGLLQNGRDSVSSPSHNQLDSLTDLEPFSQSQVGEQNAKFLIRNDENFTSEKSQYQKMQIYQLEQEDTRATSESVSEIHEDEPSSFYSIPDKATENNLDQMPPMPPLPPMQWRMGKFQHDSLDLQRELEPSQASVQPMQPIKPDMNTQFSLPSPESTLLYQTPFFPVMAVENDKLQHPSVDVSGNPVAVPLQLPLMVNDAKGQYNYVVLDRNQIQNPFLTLPVVSTGMPSHGYTVASEGEMIHTSNLYSPILPAAYAVSGHDSTAPHEKPIQPPSQLMRETSSDDKTLQQSIGNVVSRGSPQESQIIASYGETVDNSNPCPPIPLAECSVSGYESISPQEKLIQSPSELMMDSSSDDKTVSQSISDVISVDRPQHVASEGIMLQNSKACPPTHSAGCAVSGHDSISPQDELTQLSNQLVTETSSEVKTLHQPMSSVEGEEGRPCMSLMSAPNMGSMELNQSFLPFEGEMVSSLDTSDFDSERTNGKPKNKLPRPRSPLIDAVAAHDKSKLRRATERVMPQIAPKLDERDSLLEQIRTKSFNLKPAVATRPSIHGPKTNLRVAAILEKANAIRQALAGSDEDDDDSWSDS